MSPGTAQPRHRRTGTRRLTTAALAVVLVVATAACARRSSGVGDAVRAAGPTTGAATATSGTGGATTSVPGSAARTVATTRAAGATTSTRSGAVTTRPPASTTVPVGSSPEERCPVPADRVAEPSLPGGTATVSNTLGVRVAYPTGWAPTDLSLTADQLFNRIMLEEMGLPAATVVKPFTVRVASQVPGLAVVRVPRPSLSLLETTFTMADFYRSRKFVVPYRTLTACLDGFQALGLTSTNDQLLQVSWFVYRGDFMYYVLGLENDGKTAKSQTDAVKELNAVIDTLRWLD